MAKEATVGARVDAQLKAQAQEAFENMGLPMSLGIELFLRQVAETGKLPFALAGNEPAEEVAQAKRKQERDFWRSYVCWNFDAWPRFDSKSAEQRARDELDFDDRMPGDDILGLIVAQGAPTWKQRHDAERDLYELWHLMSDAKELIAWALSMEKSFAPSLAAEYRKEADEWRLRHVQDKREGRAE